MRNMSKAAIWARVSTADQDVENQIRQLEAWAGTRGFEVVKVFRMEESAYTKIPAAAYEVVRDAHRG